MYIMVMDMMVVKSLYANQPQRKMLYGIKENLKNIMKNMVFQNLEQDHQKNIQKWHMNLVLEILITLLKL